MSAKDKVKEIRERIAKLRDEAKAAAKEAFKEGIDEIFARHPDLTGIRWDQYTPYFNDGDTCRFSAHADDPELKFRGDSTSGDDEDGWDRPYGENERGKVAKEVCEFLGAFDDEDYLSMFEDHSRVTVTRRGVTVDEYEHD